MASFGQNLLGTIGNVAKGVGGAVTGLGQAINNNPINKALGAPKLQIGSGIGQLISNFGSSLVPKAYADSGNQSQQGVLGASSGQVQGPPGPPQGYVAPSAGGQAAYGGGGYSAPASSGGGLVAPSSPGIDTSGIGALQSLYANSANDLKAQEPQLDQSYNQAKGDIQASVDQNVQGADTQKQNLDQQYGDVLRNQVNTYRTLGQQRQGTFSALGSTDSSAFGDQQLKADQQLAEDSGTTQRQQVQSKNTVDSQLNTFKQQATSQLATLGQQYQQGKQAIATALSNNNIQGAQAIQQALDQIRGQASQIQNNIANFANQAQYLKSMGYGVGQSIQGISASPYAQQVNQQIGQLTAQGNQMYQMPSATGLQGQGYITNGKGQKIDPQTGQVVG